jgi:hypothetical protein
VLPQKRQHKPKITPIKYNESLVLSLVPFMGDVGIEEGQGNNGRLGLN